MNIDQLKSLGRDDLLNMFGLETKRDASSLVMPAIGLVSLGLVVGVGVGLMLAPQSGRSMRADLAHKLQRRPTEGASTSASRGSDANRVEDHAGKNAELS